MVLFLFNLNSYIYMKGIHNKYRKSHWKMDYYYTEESTPKGKKKYIKRQLKRKVRNLINKELGYE